VLDRDVERVPPLVEVGDDGLDVPVAVAVDHVAAVAPGEQLRVEAGVVGPRLGVRPDTDLVPLVRARARAGVVGAGHRASYGAGWCAPGGAHHRRHPLSAVSLGSVASAGLSATSSEDDPGPMPSCSRICASRACASKFIEACSTSSMRLSTE